MWFWGVVIVYFYFGNRFPAAARCAPVGIKREPCVIRDYPRSCKFLQEVRILMPPSRARREGA